jgi:glutathione S-transferase
MLKLYGGAFSRASIVKWYLEELGVPYEFVLVDLQAGEQLQPAFLAINPVGKVPAIVDGDVVLWESGAILLYLAERYGNPAITLAQRSEANQWILYANATMGPGIFVLASRDKEFPRHLQMLNQKLAQQPYIAGAELGVADVAVGSMLAYIPMMLKMGFDEYPAVAAYMERLKERPAFQNTILNR